MVWILFFLAAINNIECFKMKHISHRKLIVNNDQIVDYEMNDRGTEKNSPPQRNREERGQN